MRLVVALGLVAAAAPLAQAAPSPEDRARARQHYESAVTHFNLGEFADAAGEFREVYKIAPQPVLIYDAAQAYRLANDKAQALTLYRSYLNLVPATPHKGEVQRRIHELEAGGTTTAAAATAPDGPPATPTNAPVTSTTVTPPPKSDVAPPTHPDAPPPLTATSVTPGKTGGAPEKIGTGNSERLKPVVEAIRANRNGFRGCFDTWSKTHPGVNAAVSLSLYLDPEGNLDRADADARGVKAPEVEDCIEGFAHTLKYPAANNGKFTHVTYPFDFKAR